MQRSVEHVDNRPPALRGDAVYRNIMQEILDQPRRLGPIIEKISPAGDILVGNGAIARWDKLEGVYQFDK